MSPTPMGPSQPAFCNNTATSAAIPHTSATTQNEMNCPAPPPPARPAVADGSMQGEAPSSGAPPEEHIPVAAPSQARSPQGEGSGQDGIADSGQPSAPSPSPTLAMPHPGEDANHWCISNLWHEYNKWYLGIVVRFHPATGMHFILYYDGDDGWLDLEVEYRAGRLKFVKPNALQEAQEARKPKEVQLKPLPANVPENIDIICTHRDTGEQLVAKYHVRTQIVTYNGEEMTGSLFEAEKAGRGKSKKYKGSCYLYGKAGVSLHKFLLQHGLPQATLEEYERNWVAVGDCKKWRQEWLELDEEAKRKADEGPSAEDLANRAELAALTWTPSGPPRPPSAAAGAAGSRPQRPTRSSLAAAQQGEPAQTTRATGASDAASSPQIDPATAPKLARMLGIRRDEAPSTSPAGVPSNGPSSQPRAAAPAAAGSADPVPSDAAGPSGRYSACAATAQSPRPSTLDDDTVPPVAELPASAANPAPAPAQAPAQRVARNCQAAAAKPGRASKLPRGETAEKRTPLSGGNVTGGNPDLVPVKCRLNGRKGELNLRTMTIIYEGKEVGGTQFAKVGHEQNWRSTCKVFDSRTRTWIMVRTFLKDMRGRQVSAPTHAQHRQPHTTTASRAPPPAEGSCSKRPPRTSDEARPQGGSARTLRAANAPDDESPANNRPATTPHSARAASSQRGAMPSTAPADGSTHDPASQPQSAAPPAAASGAVPEPRDSADRCRSAPQQAQHQHSPPARSSEGTQRRGDRPPAAGKVHGTRNAKARGESNPSINYAEMPASALRELGISLASQRGPTHHSSPASACPHGPPSPTPPNNAVDSPPAVASDVPDSTPAPRPSSDAVQRPVDTPVAPTSAARDESPTRVEQPIAPAPGFSGSAPSAGADGPPHTEQQTAPAPSHPADAPSGADVAGTSNKRKAMNDPQVNPTGRKRAKNPPNTHLNPEVHSGTRDPSPHQTAHPVRGLENGPHTIPSNTAPEGGPSPRTAGAHEAPTSITPSKDPQSKSPAGAVSTQQQDEPSVAAAAMQSPPTDGTPGAGASLSAADSGMHGVQVAGQAGDEPRHGADAAEASLDHVVEEPFEEYPEAPLEEAVDVAEHATAHTAEAFGSEYANKAKETRHSPSQSPPTASPPHQPTTSNAHRSPDSPNPDSSTPLQPQQQHTSQAQESTHERNSQRPARADFAARHKRPAQGDPTRRMPDNKRVKGLGLHARQEPEVTRDTHAPPSTAPTSPAQQPSNPRNATSTAPSSNPLQTTHTQTKTGPHLKNASHVAAQDRQGRSAVEQEHPRPGQPGEPSGRAPAMRATAAAAASAAPPAPPAAEGTSGQAHRAPPQPSLSPAGQEAPGTCAAEGHLNKEQRRFQLEHFYKPLQGLNDFEVVQELLANWRIYHALNSERYPPLEKHHERTIESSTETAETAAQQKQHDTAKRIMQVLKTCVDKWVDELERSSYTEN